jgi:hypothetical protein
VTRSRHAGSSTQTPTLNSPGRLRITAHLLVPLPATAAHLRTLTVAPSHAATVRTIASNVGSVCANVASSNDLGSDD